MVSASLIKLFIMGAVYDKIETGVVKESDVSEKLEQMITVSDNAAANSLTMLLGNGDEETGRKAVETWAASIGCENVAYHRLMLAENDLQNYVTAQDCAEILRQIYKKPAFQKLHQRKCCSFWKSAGQRPAAAAPAGGCHSRAQNGESVRDLHCRCRDR